MTDTINTISSQDYEFPDFSELENGAPSMLYYRGNKPSALKKAVGIVGTRRADKEGIQEAFRIAFEYAANGYNIVTGLAEGCDQAAAFGCLAALKKCGRNSGVCYAIIGCGLNVKYPSQTSKLKQNIIDTGGCIISQFKPDYPPLKYNFPRRNMVIAAYSSFVVVVQAPDRSGALITADFALNSGRDVYISGAGIGKTPQRLGTDNLFADGARVVPENELRFTAQKCREGEKEAVRFFDSFYVLKDKGSFDNIRI